MRKFTGSERREHSRIPVEFPAEITLFDRMKMYNAGLPRKISIRNISAGGFAILLRHGFRRGAINALFSGKLTMYVDINLPADTLPVRAMAKTVWMGQGESRGYGSRELFLGASFVDINDLDRTRIDRYVRSSND